MSVLISFLCFQEELIRLFSRFGALVEQLVPVAELSLDGDAAHVEHCAEFVAGWNESALAQTEQSGWVVVAHFFNVVLVLLYLFPLHKST